jgi:DNA adenine methylase
VSVTVDEWHTQREVYFTQDERNPVALGFAAFFLNRTNRSGIIKEGGVIGGLEQTGKYKIGCRFNREDLSRRINRIKNIEIECIYLT